MIYHEINGIFNDTFPGISISNQTSEQAHSTLVPHWHERMEIWLICKGIMTVSCDDDIFDVKTGDVLVINPGQVHSCQVTQFPAFIHCYIFDINQCLCGHPGTDQYLHKIAKGTTRFQHIIQNNEEIMMLLQKITACSPKNAYDSLQVTGLLMQLMAQLLSHYISRENHPVPHHLQGVNELLEYIHAHYTEELTLETLAAQACMSPSYLCRWFKNAVGESPMAYLTTVRINKAYDLLASGSYSVSNACTAVGISDLNSFNRQFQKRVGILPSKVKANSKK